MGQNIVDRNPVLYKIYHESFMSGFLYKVKVFFLYFIYKWNSIIQYAQSIPRALGYNDKRFQRLKSYHNKYKGKRCFITCTGPSLTIEDLELLKDEYVFGMNSIALIHDKTKWVPDFYGIQDKYVFDKIKKELLSTNNGAVFAPYAYKIKHRTPDDWVYFHMCGKYHIYEMTYTGKYFTRFSKNCYAKIYDGYSITYSIMQLAIYMGFDEIYLLGADCSYLGKQQHFIETGVHDPQFREATQKLFTSYGKAKQYADKHGIKIYNATRGGCLELFKRVKLEDALAVSKKNKISK
jgi:hypothetical protein